MIIPTYFARERMETSRLPRAPAGIADVGAGIEALGLVGFGRILSGISSDALQNLITVRSEAQELEGTSQWERAHTEFFTKPTFIIDGVEYKGIAQDPNFENYGIKYKDFAKSLRRQVLKKGLTSTARRNLEAYMGNQQVGQEKKIAAAFLAKQRDYGRASALQSVINFEEAEDLDGAISAINHAQTVGFMLREEALSRKQNVRKNIETFRIEKFLYTNPTVVPEMIDAAEHLNPQEKNQLRSRARTAIAHRQTEAKLKQEQRDDAIGEEFLDLLVNKLEPDKPQLTFNAIAASALSLDAKEEWFTKLRVFDNYSEGELKEAFQDQGPVLSDIYNRVEENTITDKEIRDTVGKGLSPNTAESIIKDRAIWQQHEYKETDQMFKRLFGWSPELGFANDLASAFYEKVLRDWRNQVKERELKGEEIIELGRAIARPFFIEHLKTMMIGQEEDIPRIVELALGEPEEIEKIEKEEIEEEPTAEPPSEVVEKPSEVSPAAIIPEKPPIVKPKQQAARKARIRSWVVPFNLKYKTRLQPSVLDEMSDELVDKINELSIITRDKVLRAIDKGATEQEILVALELEK